MATPVFAEAGSLQALVDQAAPGSVVDVPDGIYRETVKITKPLTLNGAGAEIRGSDVWTDWTQDGDVWLSAPTVPGFPAGGHCLSGTSRCASAEQVFVDGNRLDLAGGRPTGGQFALDGSRHVLLGSDPRGHTVEVTTRTAWINGAADNVTVEGFTMKHAANTAQVGALSTGDKSNWTIQDNTLSDVHGVVVWLGKGNSNRLIGNDIARGGQLGVGGGNGAGNLIQGNSIHDNNFDGFDPEWEAGGLKAALTVNSVWDGNEVFNNRGPGLWCDINCRGLVVSNNRVHDNVRAAGILFEVSDGAKIFGNATWSNGIGMGWGWGGGIVVSSSANAEVYDNVVAWNQAGISVISQKRGDRPAQGAVNNFVHDNTIVMDDAVESLSLSFLDDSGGGLFEASANNHGDENAYWYPTPENGHARFGWRGPIARLAQVEGMPVGSGSYLSDPEQEQVLSSHGIGDLTSARRAAAGGG